MKVGSFSLLLTVVRCVLTATVGIWCNIFKGCLLISLMCGWWFCSRLLLLPLLNLQYGTSDRNNTCTPHLLVPSDSSTGIFSGSYSGAARLQPISIWWQWWGRLWQSMVPTQRLLVLWVAFRVLLHCDHSMHQSRGIASVDQAMRPCTPMHLKHPWSHELLAHNTMSATPSYSVQASRKHSHHTRTLLQGVPSGHAL